jgi:RimJ/RimL family protein N-acetyltransferase
MRLEPDVEPVRTRRLELVTLTASLADAITAGDVGTAAGELGAEVGRWLTADPSHVVQLRLAGQAAAAAGFAGLARAIVLRRGAHRQAIGSIGFHGPPDEAGRLEVSCRIHPAHRGRGYGAEATTGLLDWATARFGITRFLLAVPSRREAANVVPIEIASRRSGGPDQEIDALADMLEGDRPRS